MSGSADHTLHIYNFQTKAMTGTTTLPSSITRLDISNTNLIAASCWDGKVCTSTMPTTKLTIPRIR